MIILKLTPEEAVRLNSMCTTALVYEEAMARCTSDVHIKEICERTIKEMTNVKNKVVKAMMPSTGDRDIKPIKIRLFAADICDAFEDLLEKHNIDIPDVERTGDESEARLYGMEYDSLEDTITEILTDLVQIVRAKPNAEVNNTEY